MSSPSQPKGRFYTRLSETDFLGLTVWHGKTDPAAEVLVVQLRRREGDNWETVAKIATFRATDGKYSLIEQKEPKKAQEAI